MAYRLPVFNLSANIWRSGNPTSNPPDVVSPCQLRAAGKQSTGQDVANDWSFLWAVLFPPLTDVRDAYSAPGQDTLEVPAGSGRFYQAALVDDVAKGFTNEYRIAFVLKLIAWPSPIP